MSGHKHGQEPPLKEFSAGGLVLRYRFQGWWIAVIQPGNHGRSEDGRKRVTALPKGNVRSGETLEEAATREVFEETGLRAEPVKKLGRVTYVYRRNWGGREKISKSVTFYLMKYESGQIGKITAEMKSEVKSAHWILLREAVTKLTYDHQKRLAREALEYVQSNEKKLLSRKNARHRTPPAASLRDSPTNPSARNETLWRTE